MVRMSAQPKYSALERVLAYAAVSIIVIAVISYLTTLMVALAAGREVLADGLWQVVVFISYVGLPVGFVLVLILLAINFRSRSRERSRAT
jgi:ABC-type transport system involved in multi-copper enzyme maturation permease subunit